MLCDICIMHIYSGLSRDDPATWPLLKGAGKYGLSSRGPCFHPTLVNNRQNANLFRALQLVVNSNIMNIDGSDKSGIAVSHDRFTIYRPTMGEVGCEVMKSFRKLIMFTYMYILIYIIDSLIGQGAKMCT